MKQLDIDSLLGEEIIELDKEPLSSLVSLLKNHHLQKDWSGRGFQLKTFLDFFRKNKLIKQNKINFVWPKYINSKRLSIGSSYLWNQQSVRYNENSLPELSKDIIAKYVIDHNNIYEKEESILQSEFLDFIKYGFDNNIKPIINFQSKKNLNNLLMDYCSFDFLINKETSHLSRKSAPVSKNKPFYSNLKTILFPLFIFFEKVSFYYWSCYRGNNEMIPRRLESPFLHYNIPGSHLDATVVFKTNKSIFDYGICLVLNVFVLFKKVAEFIQFRK